MQFKCLKTVANYQINSEFSELKEEREGSGLERRFELLCTNLVLKCASLHVSFKLW